MRNSAENICVTVFQNDTEFTSCIFRGDVGSKVLKITYAWRFLYKYCVFEKRKSKNEDLNPQTLLHLHAIEI